MWCFGQLLSVAHARVLFERALHALGRERSRDVWLRYLEFENMFGDLASVNKLEKRLVEEFPDIYGM